MAVGIGAIVFGGILVGKILSQLDDLNAVFGLIAVAFGIVLPASLVVLAWTLPELILNRFAAAVVIGFVSVQLLWVPFLTVDVAMEDPWLQGVTAVHGTLAAVVWRHRLVWLYAVVQGPLVAIVEIGATDHDVKTAALNGVGATLFSGILIGVALALVSAAEHQDLVAARARAHASIEASTRTRQREQARINAIVHDDIMSVLLIAGRENHSPRVAEQAVSALASVATLTVRSDDVPDYSPSEAIIALRAAVTDHASQVAFWHSSVGTRSVPADVVEAFSESIAEAVRNSLIHGGDGDGFVHRVVTVNLTDNTLRATIQDTGRGFNPKAVAQRRLGIRVSIFERMELLTGGGAALDSMPGRGTTVTLTWVRK